MKTFRGKLAILVLAVIVPAATSWAQQVTAGITGLVSDRGKSVLPGAQSWRAISIPALSIPLRPILLVFTELSFCRRDTTR